MDRDASQPNQAAARNTMTQPSNQGPQASQGNAVGEDQQQNTTMLHNIVNRQEPPWILTWNDHPMRDSDGNTFWVSQLTVSLPDGSTLSYTGEGRRRGHAKDQAAYAYLTTHGFRAREPLESS